MEHPFENFRSLAFTELIIGGRFNKNFDANHDGVDDRHAAEQAVKKITKYINQECGGFDVLGWTKPGTISDQSTIDDAVITNPYNLPPLPQENEVQASGLCYHVVKVDFANPEQVNRERMRELQQPFERIFRGNTGTAAANAPANAPVNA